LLHHFLNESDLQWLNTFSKFDLNTEQKKGLILIREAGAIDNSTYRHLYDTLFYYRKVVIFNGASYFSFYYI